MKADKFQAEKKGIKLVLVGDVLMALLGWTFYYLTHSQAILMDGIYPFIDLIAGLLTLRVATLISKQAANKTNRPLGYAVFEPLLNFIKGIMILVVVIFATYASVKLIVNGGHQVVADIAVLYALIASSLGFGLSYMLYRINMVADSALIDVDLKGWLIGAVLSLAVGLAFALSILVEKTAFAYLVPYTDPVVLLVLIALILPMPLKILKENGMQIIGRFENTETSQKINKLVNKELADPMFIDFKMRYWQLGRSIYIQLYIQMDPDADFSLKQADEFRNYLYRKLKSEYDYLAIDVVFTADPTWVAGSVADKQ
jgi:predicted Co/Zn/Cd cation transporter (cation efflux family)